MTHQRDFYLKFEFIILAIVFAVIFLSTLILTVITCVNYKKKSKVEDNSSANHDHMETNCLKDTCFVIREKMYEVPPAFLGGILKKKEEDTHYTLNEVKVGHKLMSAIFVMIILVLFLAIATFLNSIVRESFTCDPALDCYAFDVFRHDYRIKSVERITDCSLYENTTNITTICYAFSDDLLHGLGVAGGVLTFGILSFKMITLVGFTVFSVFMFCINNRGCCKCCNVYICITLMIISIIINLFLIPAILFIEVLVMSTDLLSFLHISVPSQIEELFNIGTHFKRFTFVLNILILWITISFSLCLLGCLLCKSVNHENRGNVTVTNLQLERTSTSQGDQKEQDVEINPSTNSTEQSSLLNSAHSMSTYT